MGEKTTCCVFRLKKVAKNNSFSVNKESMENEVADVHLNVPWAQQWELKSQVDGDQKN